MPHRASNRPECALLLPPARIVQPLPEDAPQVHIGYHEVLVELAAPSDQLTTLVEDHAVAVEDQLVLPPNQVAEGDHGHIVPGSGAEHPLAQTPLAGVVGRS